MCRPIEQPDPIRNDADRRQNSIGRRATERSERLEWLKADNPLPRENARARREKCQRDGGQPEVEWAESPHALAERRRIGYHGQLGGDQQRWEQDTMLLREAGGPVEQRDRRNRARRENTSVAHSVAQI